jgi:hypothetical protein
METIPKTTLVRSGAQAWIIYLAAIAIMALVSTTSPLFAWPAWLLAKCAASHPLFRFHLSYTPLSNLLVALTYYPLFLLPIYYWRRDDGNFWLYVQFFLFFLHFSALFVFFYVTFISGGPWVK